MTDSKFFINISTYGILVIFSIFIQLINIIFLKHLRISKIISNFAPQNCFADNIVAYRR